MVEQEREEKLKKPFVEHHKSLPMRLIRLDKVRTIVNVFQGYMRSKKLENFRASSRLCGVFQVLNSYMGSLSGTISFLCSFDFLKTKH